MDSLIWLVPFLPLLGACINGLVLSRTPPRTRRRLCGWVATAASGLAFLVALSVMVGLPALLKAAGRPWVDVATPEPWIELGSLTVPFGLRIDPLSVTMMLVVTGVGTLIHLFSISYMADDERFGRFFTYLGLFMFSMLMLVLANNYVLMFVGWEGVGLCSYLLIGFWFERVSAAQAGKKAFLVNRVGDFGFLLALFAIFWLLDPHTLTYNTADGQGVLDQAAKLGALRLWGLPAVTTICLLLFLGATGKSAQLPLYVWLPDAMEGPTPVSALIHAATMVTAGVYMVARSAALFGQSPLAQTVVAGIGIFTALWAAIIAIKQYDIKRVLAYSTVSQLGYMFAGVGVGAYAAGISHLVTHAFFKALMFLGAGAVMHALEGQLDMRKMGNVKRHMPITFITFAIAWYMICGLPFGSGFFSKDAILDQAYERGFEWVTWIGVFVAGLTAFYMTRMFVTVFLGSERIEMGDEGHGGDSQEHGPSNAPGHPGHGHAADPGHTHTHDHAHDHGHDHDRGHAHVHPEQPLMNIPLIILAVASIVGAVVVFRLPGYLYAVTSGMVPHAAAEAGEVGMIVPRHVGYPGMWVWPGVSMFVSLPTLASGTAAILGVLIAWFMYGPEKFARGWSQSGERMLGFLMNTYEGFLHVLVVVVGTRLAHVLYTVVDRMIIDRLVDFMGTIVDYFAESLRTLQTGYVRNYAMVMLAGAVFVVGCFTIILQGYTRERLFQILGVMALIVGVLSVGYFIVQRLAPRPVATDTES
jgi:NADH-quinone oxidoreductase subunit L